MSAGMQPADGKSEAERSQACAEPGQVSALGRKPGAPRRGICAGRAGRRAVVGPFAAPV